MMAGISGEHQVARQVRNIAVDDWMNRCEEQAVRAIRAEAEAAELRGQLGAANERIAALEATITALQGGPNPGSELTGDSSTDNGGTPPDQQ